MIIIEIMYKRKKAKGWTVNGLIKKDQKKHMINPVPVYKEKFTIKGFWAIFLTGSKKAYPIGNEKTIVVTNANGT